MAYANTLNGCNKPGNCGNRAVAGHIKSQHDGAGKSGNSVSGQIKPSRSLAHPPGASSSVLKTPKRSFKKQMD